MVGHGRDARGGALGGLLRAALSALCVASAGCATIPPDSYGIERLRFHGVDALDDEALRACLATRERDPVQVDLGSSADPTCDVPPFDGSRISLRLFHWPWTDWPTFDAAVFERDLDRIERWYRARGYYDASVERAEYTAEGSDQTETIPTDDLPETGDAGCTRRDDDEGCVLEIDVHVHEGEPVLVRNVELRGLAAVPPRLRAPLRRAVELEVDQPFDEALHDRTKEAMLAALRDAGHACATIHGEVEIDPETRIADVRYIVEAGIVSRFREVRVELTTDAHDLPLDTIRAAAGLEPGTVYAPSKVERARNDVYALGAFSSVEAEAVPVVAEGSGERCSGDIDVVIRVTPGRRFRYGVGAGIDSGNANATSQTTSDARQWNVHVLARFEDRNFLGGIRRLRIEDRPKITFQDQFPNPGDTPRPGNEVTLEFTQPAFLERATRLSVFLRHDVGFDPIDAQYPNIVDGHIEVRRRFADNHISAAIGWNALAYLPIGDQLYDHDENAATPQIGREDTVARHALTFLSETLTVDYRDNPGRPRKGIYFQLTMQQAGLAGLIGNDSTTNPLMSWRYLRFEPDLRGFIPLPLGMVLAGRVRLGSMVILDRYGYELADAESYRLGPTAYRMRAGGPSSNRGYAASSLSDDDGIEDGGYDPFDGGLFKWEASVELRAAVTQDFGITLFADFADVNRAARFRFDQPHTALGFGIRYFTLVGPIRFDMAMLPNALATFGGATNLADSSALFPKRRPNGVHGEWTITIGEAF